MSQIQSIEQAIEELGKVRNFVFSVYASAIPQGIAAERLEDVAKYLQKLKALEVANGER